jgi:hypothetical protein
VKPAQERIDRGVRYMKRFLASDDARPFRDLPLSAQLLYITGILICDEVGFLRQEQLNEAANDQQPWTVMPRPQDRAGDSVPGQIISPRTGKGDRSHLPNPGTDPGDISDGPGLAALLTAWPEDIPPWRSH